MEKVKLERVNKDGVKEEYEMYDSFSPVRLDGETYEEYVFRRNFLKQLDKLRKQKRKMEHVSTQLIPAVNEEGKVEVINGKVNFIGKTKGITYIKKEKENESEK